MCGILPTPLSVILFFSLHHRTNASKILHKVEEKKAKKALIKNCKKKGYFDLLVNQHYIFSSLKFNLWAKALSVIVTMN